MMITALNQFLLTNQVYSHTKIKAKIFFFYSWLSITIMGYVVVSAAELHHQLHPVSLCSAHTQFTQR